MACVMRVVGIPPFQCHSRSLSMIWKLARWIYSALPSIMSLVVFGRSSQTFH